MNCSHW